MGTVENPPLVIPSHRERVTGETAQPGLEWMDYTEADLGGGFVPSDYAWTSNPKQDQDDLGCK